MHGYSLTTRRGYNRLAQVDDDLVNMARFFRALGPRQMHVHGEPTAWLNNRFGETRRPATWRAMLDSVEQIRDDIEDRPANAQRPQVYVYFAGHGIRGYRDRLDLFSTPEADADGPGYDGEIDSKLIADHILRPLAARADLHVIADACHSYNILQTRTVYGRQKLEPRPPRELAYLYDFTSAYPSAGALLATRELTHEATDYGGLFSHMVRSLAIGTADIDRDGVITYGEMARAFPQIIPSRPPTPRPEIVAPGLDPDRPFIDWRATPAARVCLPGSVSGKRILVDYKALYATINLDGEPTPLWLPPGRILGFTTWGNEGEYFRAVDGPVDFSVRSPKLPPTAVPGGSSLTASPTAETTQAQPPAPGESSAPDPTAPDADAMDYWEPLPALFDDPITDVAPEASPPVTFRMPMSVGGALLVGISSIPVLSAADLGFAPHVDLAGRVGFGRHRLLMQAGYAWWTFTGSFDAGFVPAAITGHRLGARLGYGVLTTDSTTEVSLDVLGGLHRLWGERSIGPDHLHIGELALRAVINLPFDNWSRGGLRFDGEIGFAYSGSWMGPTLRVNAGLDFEALLD